MAQTATYTRSFSGPASGQLSDAGFNRVESWTNGSGSAMPPGVMVARSSTEGSMTVVAAATDDFVGLTALSFAHDPNDLTGANGIPDKSSGNVLAEGSMFVQVEQTMAPSDSCYVRITSDGGSNTVVGRVRKDSDSGKAVLCKGLRVVKGAAAGANAELYFSRAAQAAAGDDCDYVLPQASTSASITIKAMKTRADRFFVIDEVHYHNVTGLATDGSNYFSIVFQQGSTTAASAVTNVTAVAADTDLALTNGTLASRTVPPGTQLSLVLTKTGTQTLPAGQFFVKGHYV